MQELKWFPWKPPEAQQQVASCCHVTHGISQRGCKNQVSKGQSPVCVCAYVCARVLVHTPSMHEHHPSHRTQLWLLITGKKRALRRDTEVENRLKKIKFSRLTFQCFSSCLFWEAFRALEPNLLHLPSIQLQ